ncbi:autoinducer binding domain-containing protein [Bradyrhizobium sp. SUTN9-2]|uniref:autoinducer binding domain-containing protein n=1 Tax=Bradyrhizobium sp. SUTN9-2 TaxID=1167456 RepID=UPI0024BFE6C1|nr:autoinducer binding domain-containing protein [Bradyrhizobium sp. SUTN9-2]
MDLFSFTECANQNHSLRALFEHLVGCATKEGFSEVAYGALNFVDPLRLAEYSPPTVAVKWPPAWCDRYFKRKYHTIDPVSGGRRCFRGRTCGINSPTTTNFNRTRDAYWTRRERRA